jgi:hypothetical protein
MKKVLIFVLATCFFAQASIRLQAQADLTGYGLGAGVGTEIVPLLFELGLEGSTHVFPSVKNSGSFVESETGTTIPYSGTLSMQMTRFGGYAQLHLPGIGFVPVIGLFANPILHFGTQNGVINVDGTVRPINNGYPITDKLPVHGSYFLVGFPTYFGPLFVEPAFGAQHLYVAEYANYKNTLDAQISMGVKF